MIPINPFYAEWIKMPYPFQIFSQSDYLDPDCWYKFAYWMTNSADPDQLASKPTDLDLHCLQSQGISGFSRTRVKACVHLHEPACQVCIIKFHLLCLVQFYSNHMVQAHGSWHILVSGEGHLKVRNHIWPLTYISWFTEFLSLNLKN